MIDYVIYAMFVAIGATVWLLWELVSILYNHMLDKKMRKRVFKAYEDNKFPIEDMSEDDKLELYTACFVKSSHKVLLRVYRRYFYHGKFLYE